MQQKTEISLSVKFVEEDKIYPQAVITGDVVYSNSSGYSFVTEFMILMCESVGSMCVESEANVRYKVQSPQCPLGPTELDLLEGETLFMRSSRLVRCLRAATDSKVPGTECHSSWYLFKKLKGLERPSFKRVLKIGMQYLSFTFYAISHI